MSPGGFLLGSGRVQTQLADPGLSGPVQQKTSGPAEISARSLCPWCCNQTFSSKISPGRPEMLAHAADMDLGGGGGGLWGNTSGLKQLN